MKRQYLRSLILACAIIGNHGKAFLDDYFVEYEDDSYGFSPIRDFFTPRERTIKMGDMRLTNTQYSMFFGRHRHKRSGAFGEHLRWPKGDIPYAFSKGDKEPLDHEKEVIYEGIEILNSKLHGCIKIRPKNSYDRHFVTITRGEGGKCFANVGRIKKNRINLDSKCYHKSVVMHEFIHAIGFYHEHQRIDRDDHIDIQWDNIKDKLQFAFKQQINTDTFGVPYDHLSIMHYTWRAFAKDRSKPTIESKHPSIPTKKLGSSHEPTDYDVMKIKRMYGCDGGYDGYTHSDQLSPDYDSGLDYSQGVFNEDKDFSDFGTSAYGGSSNGDEYYAEENVSPNAAFSAVFYDGFY